MNGWLKSGWNGECICKLISIVDYWIFNIYLLYSYDFGFIME